MTTGSHTSCAECRPALDCAEAETARELIFKSFGPSYFEIKEIKDLEAAADPSVNWPENYILALVGGRIVGVMHYYPQEVVIGGVASRVATLAEFCVEPAEAWQFLGATLLGRALKFISARGLFVCWGSARRLMDNYYRRFGFSGIGAYCSVVLEKARAVPRCAGLSLRPFNIEHMASYDAAHRATYGAAWCHFPRSEGKWRLIGEMARRELRMRFAEFGGEAMPSGYAIWNNEAVIEFAFEGDSVNPLAFLDAVQRETGQSISTFLVSFRHPCMQALTHEHLTLSYRRIPDAGQIAKILDRRRFLSLMHQVFSDRVNRAGLKQFRLSHEGVTILWSPSDGLQIEVGDDPRADRLLLLLLFQGIDSLDADRLGDRLWAAAFPRQYFTWPSIDGG